MLTTHGGGGRYAHGAGLGRVLATLFRGLFRRGVKTAIKAATSKTGKRLIRSAKRSAKKAVVKGAARALKGEDVVAGAKKDLSEAKRDIGETLNRAADSTVGKKGGKNKRVVVSSKRKALKKIGAGALI